MTKTNDPTFAGMLSRIDEPSLALVHSSTVLVAEETLRTATRLRMALADTDRTIAFTGLKDSDSASQLALGIALAFSQFAPGQVLLVNAGPAADNQTGPGLAEVLNGESPLASALGEPQAGGPWVLSSGNMPESRSNLFFSPECGVIFSALGQKFRYVLVDCGPLSISSSLVVIGRCDAVTLALAAGQHHRSEVAQAKGELERVKTRMLGAVITATKR